MTRTKTTRKRNLQTWRLVKSSEVIDKRKRNLHTWRLDISRELNAWVMETRVVD